MHRTPSGQAFIHLLYTADEGLTPEKVDRLRKSYTSEAFWRREMLIQADALSGVRVYPEFNPEVHVIPDEDVPKRGCIYMSIDPHPRTPHAMLWVLIDRWSDWYVYREMWPSIAYPIDGRWRRLRDDDQDNVFDTRDYATWIALFEGNSIKWSNQETDREYGRYEEKPGGERIAGRFMDQAAKGFTAKKIGKRELSYWDVYRDTGIVCRAPVKSHEVGETAIHSLLLPRKHEFQGEWPRLHIAASCKELIAEFPRHRYKRRRTISEDADLKQEARTVRTHMLDNLRYIATDRGAGYYSSQESTRFEIANA
jgi:hypothetical protein